jgi:4-aminobutyrate aminotransferase-like enzyme
MKRNILVGTSGDPNVIRILAPFILGAEHVEQLRDALNSIG